MRSRLLWRRSAAAAGTYASAALGFGATVVALHVFPTETFGLYALVLATTAPAGIREFMPATCVISWKVRSVARKSAL